MNELPQCPRCGQTVSYVRSKVRNPLLVGIDTPIEVYTEEFGCKDCGVGMTCKTEITLSMSGQEKRELFAKHKEMFIENWDEICKLKESLEE